MKRCRRPDAAPVRRSQSEAQPWSKLGSATRLVVRMRLRECPSEEGCRASKLGRFAHFRASTQKAWFPCTRHGVSVASLIRKLTRSNCRKSVWRKRGTPSLKIVFGTSFQKCGCVWGSVIIEPMVMSAGAAVHREASSLTEPQGLSFRWREAAAWLPCTHSVPDSVPHSCRRGSSSPCWSLSCLGKIFRSRRHFILSGLLLLSDVQPRIPPKVESDVFELSIGLVIIFSTVTMTLEATHPDFS